MFRKNPSLRENLAGPGGGPDMQPIDLVALNKEIASKGAGAFPQGGENPPKPVKTATKAYEDPRFARRMMRKKMKREWLTFWEYVREREAT